MAGPALTDVPDRYDVVFQLNDGSTYGFLFSDAVQSSLPFRTHKAIYSYGPTFLERQNLSNQYGDNFQDFFLTGAQADFSEGEQQHFFRVNDPDSVRKYWAGLNVDPTTIPGNVVLTPTTVSASTASGASTWCSAGSLSKIGNTPAWFGADNTNLYEINQTGTVLTGGAHGLSATTGFPYVSTDQSNVYISSEGTGSLGIRKWTGSVFSTFSSTKVSQTLFLNNILYGYQSSTDSLISFDTAGTATTQFQWKNADGTTATSVFIGMVAYGGSIFILRKRLQTELWQYDGSGCRMLANFPDDFVGASIVVSNGIVFVGGYTTISSSSFRPQIYYWANSSVGKLWESKTFSASGNAGQVAPFGSGVIFQDPITKNLLQYDLALGGVHTVSTLPIVSAQLVTSDVAAGVLCVGTGGTSYIYNASGNYNSSGYVQTSQYDFDNTLTKMFRGLKVDADIPANTSIDIAYQLDGAGGTYTTLQTGAVSGTEYNFPNTTTGHSISVQVTLKSATGAATPTLKRVYVRAAPMLQQFRYREFIFDLSSGYRAEAGKVARKDRSGMAYPYDSTTAAKNLIKIATQTIPFTVQDRFDQYTAIADLQQNSAGYDGFAIYEERPGVYIARINLREV